MLLALGMAGRRGASFGLLVVFAAYLVIVAVGRWALWHGARRGLGAAVVGGAIGVFAVFFVIPAAYYGAGALELPALRRVLLGDSYAAAWYMGMLGAALLFAVVGYLWHLLLSACECIWRLVCEVYLAWQAREPLWAAIRRQSLCRAGGYAFLVAAGALLYPGVEMKLCAVLARQYLSAAIAPPLRSQLPMVEGFMRLQFGSRYHARPNCCYELYLSCRDRLLACGALVHRRFVFKNVKDGTPAAAGILRAAFAGFPRTIQVEAQYAFGGPLAIDVYAPPREILEWEAFVREHDEARP